MILEHELPLAAADVSSEYVEWVDHSHLERGSDPLPPTVTADTQHTGTLQTLDTHATNILLQNTNVLSLTFVNEFFFVNGVFQIKVKKYFWFLLSYKLHCIKLENLKFQHSRYFNRSKRVMLTNSLLDSVTMHWQAATFRNFNCHALWEYRDLVERVVVADSSSDVSFWANYGGDISVFPWTLRGGGGDTSVFLGKLQGGTLWNSFSLFPLPCMKLILGNQFPSTCVTGLPLWAWSHFNYHRFESLIVICLRQGI